MEILREYYLQDSRTPFYRCSSTSRPNTGENVNIKGVNYIIISSKYDYEVWQSTGIFVFSCVVKKSFKLESITQKILKYFAVDSPIEFNAIDFINGSYPGGDIGDYMHDDKYRYLVVAKYMVNDKFEANLIEQELSKDQASPTNFEVRFTRLDNTAFILDRSIFKAKLYWPGIYIPSFSDIYNRDGSAEILIQIVVPKGISTDFDKFIQDCMSFEMY